jgi:signal transduction histidine kinase
MGFAHVLGDNFGTTQDEVRKITSMMSYNAMLLKRMVLMLYDSSDTGLNEEQKCLKNEQVLCNELARECIDVTHGRFPDVTVAFTTDLPDDLHVLTNRTYLLRSLLELLYNAVKFSDRQHVSLLLTKTDARVLFIIQDVGPGIARDDQKQMYVPFSKRDDLSEGLGLGLPLAKRHADTLGGDLSLDADYRQGCRFIFEVPL